MGSHITPGLAWVLVLLRAPLSPGSDGDPCGSLSPAPEGVWAALLNVPHRLTCLPFPQLRRAPAICPGEGLALTGVHVMLTFGPSQKKKNKDHL